VIAKQQPPAFGAFKNGDPAHKGYNKTIGKNWPYIEDPLIDTVKYHPNSSFSNNTGKSEQAPIHWKGPTNGIATPIKSIHDNFRNAGKEPSNQLLKSTESLYTNNLVMASRKKQ
jgi:hypothetical protein